MSYRDVYIAERTMHLNVEKNLQDAEIRNLIHQYRSARPGWLSRAIRAMLCTVGYRLVVMGAWLEQYSLPQPPTLEGNPG